MRRVPSSSARTIALAVAFCGLGIAGGCGRETFNLLPDESRAGTGAGGAPSAGVSGTPSSGTSGGIGEAGSAEVGGSGGVLKGGAGGAAGRGSTAAGGSSGTPPCLGEGGCQDQDPCPVTAPFCFPCTEKDSCAFTDYRYCDLELKVCVQCRNNNQCRIGEACNPFTHRCAPACNDADECGQDNDRFLCAADIGVCVACIKDADCGKFGQLAPHCVSSICVECSQHWQCPNQLCIGGRCSKP